MLPGSTRHLTPVSFSWVGKILAALLGGPGTAIDVADNLADFTAEPPVSPPPSVVMTYLIWMHHMGIVTPAAMIANGSHGGMWDVLWEPTPHALQHRYLRSDCWACRIRQRYMAMAEAMVR